MERRLAEIPTEDWSDLQIDVTPREYVMDYLMKYVPDCLTGGDKYLEIFFRANTANTITSGAYEIHLNLISHGARTRPREG